MIPPGGEDKNRRRWSAGLRGGSAEILPASWPDALRMTGFSARNTPMNTEKQNQNEMTGPFLRSQRSRRDAGATNSTAETGVRGGRRYKGGKRQKTCGRLVIAPTFFHRGLHGMRIRPGD